MLTINILPSRSQYALLVYESTAVAICTYPVYRHQLGCCSILSSKESSPFTSMGLFQFFPVWCATQQWFEHDCMVFFTSWLHTKRTVGWSKDCLCFPHLSVSWSVRPHLHIKYIIITSRMLLPCDFTLVDFGNSVRRLLCVATMSSLAQLQV